MTSYVCQEKIVVTAIFRERKMTLRGMIDVRDVVFHCKLGVDNARVDM